jgi:hypothetical protein
MRAAPLVCAALLLAGHALAQDAAGGGDGAMCRGFCDADAKRCQDRFAASQTCTAARRACVQRCAAPAAASASAP